MDEEKQIEEMARDMDYGCVKRDLYPDDAKEIAKALYLLGYRKIPENAVVLTREDLFRDSTQLSKEKQIEIIHNIILENVDYGYKETATAIYDANYRKIPKLGVILPFDHYDNLLKSDKQIRKETAEKFAERLKTESFDGGIDDKRVSVSFSRLDEICKEITEGKV